MKVQIKTQMVRSLMMTSLSLAMLAGCNPPNTSGPTPSASPTASASPSALPSPGPSAEPTASPSAIPSADPSANPSADPSASSSPTASPTGDVSVNEKTTFNGKVYDDSNAPLEGATVKARSLSEDVTYEVTTTTTGGAYAFNNAPAGIQLEITTTKAGYTSRRRVEVLKSNISGDPNANRYDFGTNGPAMTDFGVAYNGLSDKPEVISVTPGRNASGVAPNTSFILAFSEPMDRNTVEKNFGIYAGSNETLSVDSVAPTLIQGFSNAYDVTPAASSLVWSKSAFSLSWNADDTELTLNFKDERRLPSDKDSNKVPDYQVSLTVDDGQIKDKNGVSRAAADGGYFKLTDGQFEGNYKFAINRDTEAPQADSLKALTGENGNLFGDEIKVVYSEPMVYYTAAGEIRGNMAGGVPSEDPLSANNYFISINGGAEQNLAGLGGTALFDATDASHKTVMLRFFGNLYTPGDNVKVRVNSSVLDPAGNSVDSSNDEADNNAN
ncbi:MAG: hypothetical protein CVV27_05460 [Candidatus Melainabacteria bacterium HGW-Melainabacteria-1]|nr:MAG: hypothetical protein CVV27_05460 [Candidatus Melainabacteria bacterium HGW-Melainabacteria-1]